MTPEPGPSFRPRKVLIFQLNFVPCKNQRRHSLILIHFEIFFSYFFWAQRSVRSSRSVCSLRSARSRSTALRVERFEL